MQSMTGFGSASAGDAVGTVAVQISAVNNRGCQIQVKGDLRDLAIEEAVKRRVREALVRGSITVHFSHHSHRALALDGQRLQQAWRELAALAMQLGAPPPALEQVARLQSFPPSEDPAAFQAMLDAALGKALAAVLEMRQREGTSLAAAFHAQSVGMRAACAAIGDAAAGRVARHHDLLVTRLREILAERPVSDEVLVRELAIYADRIDISEELVRLGSHLDALDQLLADRDEAIGRKLEFLLQELGREINTVGSKANDVAVTRLVLEAKSLLEQMKEQAANIS